MKWQHFRPHSLQHGQPHCQDSPNNLIDFVEEDRVPLLPSGALTLKTDLEQEHTVITKLRVFINDTSKV